MASLLWIGTAAPTVAASVPNSVPAGGSTIGEPGASDGVASLSSGLSISLVSDPYLRLASNSPRSGGPRAAYVAFEVTNTSGAAVEDLRASIGGFAQGIALAGGQSAGQYLGRIGAGASRTVYWFVEYPCATRASATLTVSVTNGSGDAAMGSGRVETGSAVGAAAGGEILASRVGAGAVVGQVVHLEVEHMFGAARAGDTYNLQPAGEPSFNAGCFQLVGSEIIGSSIPAIPVGTRDRQYFTASTQRQGREQRATIRYSFRYLCAGVGSTPRPYAVHANGVTSVKYSGNYLRHAGPAFPAATIGFTVSKSVSPASLTSGGEITYAIVIRNTSVFTAAIDSIADLLPSGVTYTGLAAGSGVTAANSSSLPASPSTGVLKWRGVPGSSYIIPGGGTLTLAYTATVSSEPGEYVNSASGYAGTTVVGTAHATVSVGAPTYAVTVSPQGLASPVRQLAGTEYSQAFTVTSLSSVAADFDLLARVAGASGSPFAVDSITGAGIAGRSRPDSVRVRLLPDRPEDYTVWYSVAAGEAGEAVLYLQARAAEQSAVQAEGWAELRRVLPVLTLFKSVVPEGNPPPGTDLTYTLRLTNAGEADAQGVIITDLLPSSILFKVGSTGETLPAGVTAVVDYSADGGAGWSHVPVSGGCGAPAGYDACVQHIRWTLQGELPPDPVQSAWTLQFLARIR